MTINYGLYWLPSRITLDWQYEVEYLVPLKKVHVEAVIVETTAEVKLTQVYENNQDQPIEAIYVFPIDDHAAVCEFEANIDGKIITGIVKPKNEAKEKYDKAVKKGHGAYLLEQHKDDIFRAKVGNIPPGKTVSISIKYVSEIQNELEKMRFFVPTHVEPRYTPAGSTPTPDSNFSTSTSTMTANITVFAASQIESIESPSHTIETSINDCEAKVSLPEAIKLDKDFVLILTYSKPHEPKVIIQKDSTGDYAAMITLFPDLEFAEFKTELIFVIDRSGSMGPNVNELREAMQLFLRSLPSDCYFNIIGFGSSYECFFPHSRLYNDETLTLASDHVSHLNANLGGTEILEPLKYIFKTESIPNYARQIFVLTDGEVDNTEEVIQLISKNVQNSRVFSLGIGNSVSHYLVDGIARAGKGTAFFAMEGERIEKKILKQLRDATQPALNHVNIDWKVQTSFKPLKSILNFLTPSKEPQILKQAPFVIPPIFSQLHFRIYAIFNSELPQSIIVKAQSPDGELQVELKVDQSKIIPGDLLHILAARTLIRDLEEGKSFLHSKNSKVSSSVVQKEVLQLALKYKLASSETSFLAIEKRDNLKDKEIDNSDLVFQQNEEKHEEKEQSFNDTSFKKKSKKMGSIRLKVPTRSTFSSSGHQSKNMLPATYMASSLSPSRGVTGGGGGVGDSNSESDLDEEESHDEMKPQAESSNFDNFKEKKVKKKEKKSLSLSAKMDHDIIEKEKEEPELRKMKPNSRSQPSPQPSQQREFQSPPPPPSQSSSMQQSFSPPPPPLSLQPSSSQPINPRTLLTMTIKLQKAQGFFLLDDNLAKILEIPLSALKEQLQNLTIGGDDEETKEKIFATTLALTFLAKKLSNLKEEWEMVDGKARKWLNSHKLENLPDIFANSEKLVI